MHIGERIKQLVETEQLSITEVARTIDKTRQTVYDLYTKSHVSTEILEKLSKKYAIPIAYFFDEYFLEPLKLTLRPSADSAEKATFISGDPQKDLSFQSRERLADLTKIIYLQDKLLTYEQARQSFLLLLDRLRQSIIEQRGYQKQLPPNEEKESLNESSFSEAYFISTEDNQKAYEELFKIYQDFGVFFSTGFITDVYWKRAWHHYQQRTNV